MKVSEFLNVTEENRLLSPFYFVIPKKWPIDAVTLAAAAVYRPYQNRKEILLIQFNEDYEVINEWFVTDEYCRDNYMYLTTEDNRDRLETTIVYNILTQLKMKHNIEIKLTGPIS